MTEKTVQIEVPLIFPDLDEDCDQCLERVQQNLEDHKGILSTHLECSQDQPVLCIHYQPNLISLDTVRQITRRTGMDLVRRYRHQRIPLEGLENADQAPGIRRALENLPGMLHAQVNYAAGLAFLAYERGALEPEQIAQTLKRRGVRPVDWPPEKTGRIPETGRGFLPRWIEERRDLVLVGLTGLFLVLGWTGARWFNFPPPLPLVLFILAYLTGGGDILLRAVPGMFRGSFDTDVLMLAAAGGAAALGEWSEGALLLFLFSLGHAGEHYALDRARRAVNALAEMIPSTARVRRGEEIHDIPVEHIQVGERVLVRPEERVPVDGRVVSGESAVDQSPITGESVPVTKTSGDQVFAGSVNQQGRLEVESTAPAADNTLARLMELVAEAQSQHSPTQRFTDRFTSWFVPAVLSLVVLVLAVPPALGWMTFQDSFYRAMLLLVAASPCALALGTPAAVLTGIAQAARSGVLIKGGAHLENLGELQVMALDKTGTLTEGRFQITDLIPRAGVSESELLRIAAAVEVESQHPLGAAVVDRAHELGLQLPEASSLENISGRGLRSEIEGQRVLIGSRDLFQNLDTRPPEPELVTLIKDLEKEGKTTMAVQVENTYLGVIALRDTPRPGVKDVLQDLKRLGMRELVMLTGDNHQVAEQIGRELGVTDVRSGLMPQEKLDAVKQLQEETGRAAMVGDGINDAPALAASTVGIAMGGAGTAAALETSDVALMADDLSKLPYAIGLSRASRRVIRQNLALALGVIILLVVSSVLGWFPLGWAVALHEGSSLAVVLNALRLLGYKEQ